MHNLRDHLLKAGLVTQEQVTRIEEKGTKRKKRKNNNKRKADAKNQPVNRMVDLSDPKRLEIAKAIEQHKVRGDLSGELQFHFALRDGRVRKMFVSKETQASLEGGRYAIVENGDADHHLIVSAEAVATIAALDADAVRFHNKN